MKWNYPENWDILSKQIKKRDNYRCSKCGNKFSPNLLRTHHIVPLSKGGSNKKTNLQTLCFFCHSLKHKHLKNIKVAPKKFKKFGRYPSRF